MRRGRSSCITQNTQKVCLLVIRSRAFEGLLRPCGHHLDGDRDNMVRRTREVRRDLKPPRNPRSNGISLVSIDEEMCPLRLQRQQGHVGHRQTHGLPPAPSARYYYIGIVNRVCEISYRRRTESGSTRGSEVHFTDPNE